MQKRVLRRQSGGRLAAPAHLIPVEPNDLWSVDFKGWWRTKDGMRCDPLTIRDGFSRYVLALRLLTRTLSAHWRRRLLRSNVGARIRDEAIAVRHS